MLKGKTALITGASRGIGAAIALKFASLGADIAIVYAGNEEAANKVTADCLAFGVRAEAYKCDVSDFEAAKNTVAAVKASFNRVDILVNNAGITRDGLIAMMKEEDFDAVIGINLKGAFNMIRHCTPFLYGPGAEPLLISVRCRPYGNPGQVNYSASKAGLIGLTKSVARACIP